MSWDTLRGNKMRSALTVLGIVIGITSIVGMTSLLRGFDESFKRLDQDDRPGHDLRREVLGVSLASGGKVQELLKRPNLTTGDADAIERNAPSIEVVDIIAWAAAGRAVARARLLPGNQKTKTLQIFGTTERWPSA